MASRRLQVGGAHVVKHYYKVLDENGEVIAVGYGYNDGEITKEEYDRLRAELLETKSETA